MLANAMHSPTSTYTVSLHCDKTPEDRQPDSSQILYQLELSLLHDFSALFMRMRAFIGERERANLLVRTARFYTTVRTSSTRFFLSEKHFKFLHRIFLVYITRGSQPQFQRWIGLEEIPFVVDEKGKENVVPVRLLSREARLSRR